ncbi:MAG: hypothetical protein ACRCX8_02610 [Sarcina sp.]
MAISINTDSSNRFKNWLTDIVLPHLREHGLYVTGMEKMNAKEIKQVTDERLEKYIFRKYGIKVRRSLTDTIKNRLNPTPSQSYIYADYTNLVYKVLFGMTCQDFKETKGMNKKDNLRDNIPKEQLNLIAKAEEFVANMMLAGVIEKESLSNMLNTWYGNIDLSKII